MTMREDALDDYERRYMDPGERLLYREKVVSRTAFRVSVVMGALFGLAGLTALGFAALSTAPAAGNLALGIPFVALAAMFGVLGVLFSVFRIMLTSTHLHVHFGWAKRKVALQSIGQVSAVTLRGLRQGKVQIGLDGVVRTWVGDASSGRGVEIAYQDGRRKHVLTIGSERAEELAATLQRAREAALTGAPIGHRIAPAFADDEADHEAAEDEAAAAEGDAAEKARR